MASAHRRGPSPVPRAGMYPILDPVESDSAAEPEPARNQPSDSEEQASRKPARSTRRVSTANTFKVLMWQHGMYYRRHKCSLVCTLIMPVILGILMLLAAGAFQDLVDRRNKTEKADSEMRARRETVTEFEEWGTTTGQSPEFDIRMSMQEALGTMDQTEGKKPLKKLNGTANATRQMIHATKCNAQIRLAEKDLLKYGYVAYYPQTNEADEVVGPMREVYKNAYKFKSNSTRMENVEDCMKNYDYKFMGFASRKEAETFTGQVCRLARGCSHMAVLNFNRIAENQFTVQNVYGRSGGSVYEKIGKEVVYMVDAAILDRDEKGALAGHRLTINPLPELQEPLKNSDKDMVGKVVQALALAMIVISAFFICINLTKQLVYEKGSGFQTYLNSIGVSSAFVSITWIVACIGITLAATLLEHIVLGMNPAFEKYTGLGLFLVIAFFNVNQLAVAIFLASLITDHKYVTRIHVIVTMLSVTACIVATPSSPDMFFGSELGKQRLMALFLPIVNAATALSYLRAWGVQVRLTVSFRELWLSPYQNDMSGGLGECFAIFVASTILFLGLGVLLEPAMKKIRSLFRKSQPTEKSTDTGPSQVSSQNGISLVNLTKSYGGTKALRNVSASFQMGKVTVLLGENGAGKSTTMEIMTGLQRPTEGCVFFEGKKLSKNKKLIQDSMSYLPQMDMYYPYLTLREHVRFFGRLRGLSLPEIEAKMPGELAAFGLTDSQNVRGNKLSGGQKRKLGLLISYMPDPRYVVLDEVTTGIDPYSARAIWAAILAKKTGTTTIVSTHSMEEAEALADNVVILSRGKASGTGTPSDLKDRFGKGFEIVVACSAMTPDERAVVKECITRWIPGTAITESTEVMSMTTTKAQFQSQAMLKCFQDLERWFEQIGKGSFGVNEPSLQQVFFAVTKKGTDSKAEAEAPLLFDRQPESGPRDCGKRFAALLCKRILQSLRSPLVIVFQLILPLVLVTFSAVNPTQFYWSRHDQTVDRSYRVNVWFIIGQNTTPNSLQTDAATSILSHGMSFGRGKAMPKASTMSTLPFGPNDEGIVKSCILENDGPRCGVVKKAESINYQAGQDGARLYSFQKKDKLFNTWLYAINQTRPRFVVAGMEFTNQTVSLYSQKGLELAAINLLANSILLSDNFTTPSKPIKVTLERRKPSSLTNVLLSAITTLFLGLALYYGASDCQQAIASDAESGVRKFMFTTKLQPWLYWTTNLVYDVSLAIVTVVLTGTVLAAAFGYGFGSFFTVAVACLYETAAYVYVTTSLRRGGSRLNQLGTSAIWIVVFTTVFPAMLVIHLVLGGGGKMALSLEGTTFAKIVKKASMVLYFFRCLPAPLMAEIAVVIGMSDREGNKGMRLADDYFDKVIGAITAQALVVGSLYFSLVLLHEQWNVFNLRKGLRGQRAKQGSSRLKDQDVTNEENIVAAAPQSFPVAAVALTKKFRGMPVPSVDNVTFAVRERECFGLLGVNGAGKTTTFKMLLGLENPTHGTGYIHGHDIHTSEKSKAKKLLSYCAQEFTLCEYLTAKQHIQMFAAIQGITSREVVDQAMQCIGLVAYKNTRVKHLSFGNKKKVQFMCALMAMPKVLFLDEPTSGMDPTAQRMLWKLVKKSINQGASVLLTSHNMFECEHLCDRLAVMVGGQLRCLGTVQYLKNKVGNRYSVRLRFKQKNYVPIQDFMAKAFGHQATLLFEHSTGLAYEVNVDVVGRVSYIFEMVHECNSRWGLDGFSVSQLSLENVFVAVAQTP